MHKAGAYYAWKTLPTRKPKPESQKKNKKKENNRDSDVDLPEWVSCRPPHCSRPSLLPSPALSMDGHRVFLAQDIPAVIMECLYPLAKTFKWVCPQSSQ